MNRGRQRVTVSVPYHGCPSTIRRAVDAVLAQTHQDLVCVVVNDGDHAYPPWPHLADINDPRLRRVDLPTNRGRYFADAVTLATCTTPWWTIHDADDEADPAWLATMLEAADHQGAEVVLTAQAVHHLDGRVELDRPLPWLDGAYRHHGHMAGLWSTTWLRSIGGPHPGYRVGWDTMLTGTALAMGAATILERPLYTRHRRRGSLTTAPATGMRSPLRRRTVVELRRLWPLMVAAAPHGPGAVRLVLTGSRITGDWDAVTDQALRLYRPATLDEPGLWSGWALDAPGAQLVYSRLVERRPRLIVEAGSGASTVLLAEYARAARAHVVSLEHQARYREATAQLLAERGLADYVDLRLATLMSTPAGPWYNIPLPDGIDFALIDGPPEGAGGRAAAFPELLPHLAEGAELVLDDAHRPGERTALAQWECLGAAVTFRREGAGKAVALVHPPARSRAGAEQVVVTLLTGTRPELLARTLASLRDLHPHLLEDARVVVLHNGGDPGTSASPAIRPLAVGTRLAFRSRAISRRPSPLRYRCAISRTYCASGPYTTRRRNSPV
ncbi:glycosyltransferase [Nocardiopsis sp. FR26]|uniref:glycosyltransferase n=1 Tax=Nocardiopsis sp. FR26 TaxID=2605987 RepID=UPI00135B0E27|nr:glycosyltransferase [Nocardiopsis sp. FR26]